MRDGELVASIVAGDPEGLAAAYDRYAGDLYGSQGLRAPATWAVEPGDQQVTVLLALG